MEFKTPDIYEISCGYLSTPISKDTIQRVIAYDHSVNEREDTGWVEYTISEVIMYPHYLRRLYNLGMPFFWEYMFTEDFSYYAYFFPTENNPTYYGFYSTTDRKNKPKGLRKNLKAINEFAAASELLFKIGVNRNGTN